MERYNKIIEHPLFKSTMTIINKKEETRIFCCHSIEHCLDVARIAYILSFENKLNISKDIIYSTALLHDLGRAFDNKEHNSKSAQLSTQILKDCNFNEKEISSITTAILNHRQDVTTLENLSDIICKADKLSRQCYSCKAQKECYWNADRRNMNIKY